MSSIVLAGDTSGSLTLTAPAVAGSNTQTLVATTTTLAPIVSGTAVPYTSFTTTTYNDFLDIPSWVKRITVMFNGVSLSGTSNALVQIGTSSGVENTSYSSSSGYVVSAGATTVNSSTAGFIVSFIAPTNAITAVATINLLTSNTWISAHSGSTGGLQAINGAGNKTLSGTLDRVRITTVNGTDTFDAGSINILYE